MNVKKPKIDGNETDLQSLDAGVVKSLLVYHRQVISRQIPAQTTKQTRAIFQIQQINSHRNISNFSHARPTRRLEPIKTVKLHLQSFHPSIHPSIRIDEWMNLETRIQKSKPKKKEKRRNINDVNV